MNLDVEAKKRAMLVSRQAMLYSEACDKELKELFGNADLPFSTWSDSLNCDRITINKSTVKICFVGSDFYYFNILFENGQLIGHSIDH